MNILDRRISSIVSVLAPQLTRMLISSGVEGKQVVEGFCDTTLVDANITVALAVPGETITAYAGARQVRKKDKVVVIGGRAFN